MKLTLSILTLSSAACFGQLYSINDLATTNSLPDDSTNTTAVGSSVDLTRYTDFALQFKFEMDAAGTASNAATFTFARSLDDTNWLSATDVFTLKPDGTNSVVTNTTVTVDGMGYFKLESIVNPANGAAITNLTVLYAVKPSRRDR